MAKPEKPLGIIIPQICMLFGNKIFRWIESSLSKGDFANYFVLFTHFLQDLMFVCPL